MVPGQGPSRVTRLRSKQGLHTRTWIRQPIHELTRTALCVTFLNSRAITWLQLGNLRYGSRQHWSGPRGCARRWHQDKLLED